MHAFDASPSPSVAWLQVHSAVPGAAPQGRQPAGKTATSSHFMASSPAPSIPSLHTTVTPQQYIRT